MKVDMNIDSIGEWLGSGRLPANMATVAEDEDISYPLSVEYCGICGMPPEYCEYSPTLQKCHEWMKVHLPEYYTVLVEQVGDQVSGLSVGKSKSRGGKAIKKPKKAMVKAITISMQVRSKKKSVTVVSGLRTCDIDLKRASKAFATHFSCGSSVTGDDEIVIQGDVCHEVADYIPKHWPEVDDGCISVVSKKK